MRGNSQRSALVNLQCDRLLADFFGKPYSFTAETFVNATLMCGIVVPLKRDRLDNPTKIASAISLTVTDI